MLKLSPTALLLLLLLGGSGLGWWISHHPMISATEQPEAEDLNKQIILLEGQVEYLQGQVGALQDENAKLLEKMGTLGMKGVLKRNQALPSLTIRLTLSAWALT